MSFIIFSYRRGVIGSSRGTVLRVVLLRKGSGNKKKSLNDEGFDVEKV